LSFRIFLSQYHEKDMERIQQKLKQKEEEMARREEKRMQELEKVREWKGISCKWFIEVRRGINEKVKLENVDISKGNKKWQKRSK
jgi:hypothetical protein